MNKNRLVGIIGACAIVAIAAIVPFAFKPWQGPASVAWSVTFGGSELDGGRSVQQTADGGYVITGHAMSYGTSKTDVWLIKTDSLGNMAWNKTFGGSDRDWGTSVQQTSDGGYVVAGYTHSYGAGRSDVWLIETDSLGNMAWNKTFGGSRLDYGLSVQQTSDGGYVVAGSTYSYGAGRSDVWLIKTDSLGNMAWNETFGGSGEDMGYSVQQTSDGGYVVAGYTHSYGAGESDVWLIKTDSIGNVAWNQTFGDSEVDRGYSVQQTQDGGYIIAGYTGSYGAGRSDFWLIKTDSLGNMAWNQTFGGSSRDEAHSVQQASDGGYVLTGLTYSYGAGRSDVWLIKTDSLGNMAWNHAFGDSEVDRGYSVQQTQDGGYIIGGLTLSCGAAIYDVWLIKVTV